MGFRRSLVRIQSPRHSRTADSSCQRFFSFDRVCSSGDVGLGSETVADVGDIAEVNGGIADYSYRDVV